MKRKKYSEQQIVKILNEAEIGVHFIIPPQMAILGIQYHHMHKVDTVDDP